MHTVPIETIEEKSVNDLKVGDIAWVHCRCSGSKFHLILEIDIPTSYANINKVRCKQRSDSCSATVWLNKHSNVLVKKEKK